MGGETGTRDRWEDIGELGEGGQGLVTLVRDRYSFQPGSLQSTVIRAIKELSATVVPRKEESFETFRRAIIDIVNAELPQNQGALKQLHEPGSARDPNRAGVRMLREIDAMSKVSHPNLLRILDSNAEQAWYVSEYHPNGTLAKKNDVFQGDFPGALRALRPLISGVAVLHEGNYVHRDIKPANVFLSIKNELILGDFGLVFLEDGDETRVSDMHENVGSRDWMAPWISVVRADKIPASADVFSLGKVLWSMVSGNLNCPTGTTTRKCTT